MPSGRYVGYVWAPSSVECKQIEPEYVFSSVHFNYQRDELMLEAFYS